MAVRRFTLGTREIFFTEKIVKILIVSIAFCLSFELH